MQIIGSCLFEERTWKNRRQRQAGKIDLPLLQENICWGVCSKGLFRIIAIFRQDPYKILRAERSGFDFIDKIIFQRYPRISRPDGSEKE